MSSPDPSAHKRIGRGVRNFDNAVWDRVCEDAFLAGNLPNSHRPPTMKQHLLSTGNKRLAEASPFDPVWGIGLQTTPRLVIPAGGQGKNCSKKTVSIVRDSIRTSEVGLANPAPCKQFCTPTSPGGIPAVFMRFPQRRLSALARACPGPPSEFSTRYLFSNAPAYHSPEMLAVASGVDLSLALPEHGPCLVGGIITLEDDSFTTKIAVHSGANALATFGCVVLLDTGSPQSFIRRDVLERACSRWGQQPSMRTEMHSSILG